VNQLNYDDFEKARLDEWIRVTKRLEAPYLVDR
jgi:hypothetical protein